MSPMTKLTLDDNKKREIKNIIYKHEHYSKYPNLSTIDEQKLDQEENDEFPQDKNKKVNLIEISPKGTFIAAQINNDIFIKVIHLSLTAHNQRFKNIFDY